MLQHTMFGKLRLGEPPHIQEPAPWPAPPEPRTPSAGIDTRRVCQQSRFSLLATYVSWTIELISCGTPETL